MPVHVLLVKLVLVNLSVIVIKSSDGDGKEDLIEEQQIPKKSFFITLHGLKSVHYPKSR